MDEKILKGNYKIPDENIPEIRKEETEQTLEEEFEAAAAKKLRGSVTFVKKRGSGFTWRGRKNG